MSTIIPLIKIEAKNPLKTQVILALLLCFLLLLFLTALTGPIGAEEKSLEPTLDSPPLVNPFEKLSKEEWSRLVLDGDYKTTVPILLPLAQAGDAEIQFLLGLAYDKGQNYKEAIQWYKKSAQQGHAEAQFSLAYMCEAGEGVEKDMESALYWYKKAALQDLAEAQLRLGILYEEGRGIEPDLSEAFLWYSKAARQGLALAQYALAFMHQEGHGTEQDELKAAQWYEKAAEKGLAVAQFRTGLLYASGTGVEQNMITAAQWYELASNQGLAEAQLLLGLLYEEGFEGEGENTFPVDYEKAAQWYEKAATQGNGYGQMALGTFYLTGQGVDQNFILAYMWLNLAAQRGNEEAVDWLDVVTEEMKPEQITEAKRKATQWVSTLSAPSAFSSTSSTQEDPPLETKTSEPNPLPSIK